MDQHTGGDAVIDDGRGAVMIHSPDSSEPVPQDHLVDDELEELDIVDGDDRNPLEIGPQQPLVALDVALLEFEGQLDADPLQHGARVVAEVAAGAAVEDDDAHRSGPSPVA